MTIPSSWGYEGNSLVQVANITARDSLVTFTATAAEDHAVNFDFSFDNQPLAVLNLTVYSVGTILSELACSLSTVGTSSWGQFAGGSDTAEFTLEETAPGIWQPTTDIIFELIGVVPPGGTTQFSFNFSSTTWTNPEVNRTWVWQDPVDPLDFNGDWPGQWTVAYGGDTETTTWHRWVGPPFLNSRETPILAATGSNFSTSDTWPNVHYNNNAWVTLNSGDLGPGAQAVRVVHTIETEILTPGEAMDGGRLNWLGPGGAVQTSRPLDGWDARIISGSSNALAGQEVFADSSLAVFEGVPIWQVDVVPLPDEPGPWSLQLDFASNSLWRYRGWFVADLKVLDVTPDSAFPIQWQAHTGLDWDWPYPDLVTAGFFVQTRAQDGVNWIDIISVPEGTSLPAGELLSYLDQGGQTRHLVRVTAATPLGRIASPPVVVYPDGGYRQGSGLGPARPNPAWDQVQFSLELPPGSTGILKIYDLRGRLVLSSSYPSGNHLITWDGNDLNGERVAAGIYIIRLEGSSPVITRKVVLLH